MSNLIIKVLIEKLSRNRVADIHCNTLAAAVHGEPCYFCRTHRNFFLLLISRNDGLVGFFWVGGQGMVAQWNLR